jgi:hypothetical protein
MLLAGRSSVVWCADLMEMPCCMQCISGQARLSHTTVIGLGHPASCSSGLMEGPCGHWCVAHQHSLVSGKDPMTGLHSLTLISRHLLKQNNLEEGLCTRGVSAQNNPCQAQNKCESIHLKSNILGSVRQLQLDKYRSERTSLSAFVRPRHP